MIGPRRARRRKGEGGSHGGAGGTEEKSDGDLTEARGARRECRGRLAMELRGRSTHQRQLVIGLYVAASLNGALHLSVWRMSQGFFEAIEGRGNRFVVCGSLDDSRGYRLPRRLRPPRNDGWGLK